jgi:hypothetical protein
VRSSKTSAKLDFMETVSEKRKRGRPRATDKGVRKGWERDQGEDIPTMLERLVAGERLSTRRSHLNRAYAVRAMSVLDLPDNETFARYFYSGKYHIRWTVLTALGRFEEEQEITRLANEIVKNNYSARDAVDVIRSEYPSAYQVSRRFMAKLRESSE